MSAGKQNLQVLHLSSTSNEIDANSPHPVLLVPNKNNALSNFVTAETIKVLKNLNEADKNKIPEYHSSAISQSQKNPSSLVTSATHKVEVYPEGYVNTASCSSSTETQSVKHYSRAVGTDDVCLNTNQEDDVTIVKVEEALSSTPGSITSPTNSQLSENTQVYWDHATGEKVPLLKIDNVDPVKSVQNKLFSVKSSSSASPHSTLIHQARIAVRKPIMTSTSLSCTKFPKNCVPDPLILKGPFPISALPPGVLATTASHTANKAKTTLASNTSIVVPKSSIATGTSSLVGDQLPPFPVSQKILAIPVCNAPTSLSTAGNISSTNIRPGSVCRQMVAARVLPKQVVIPARIISTQTVACNPQYKNSFLQTMANKSKTFSVTFGQCSQLGLVSRVPGPNTLPARTMPPQINVNAYAKMSASGRGPIDIYGAVPVPTSSPTVNSVRPSSFVTSKTNNIGSSVSTMSAGVPVMASTPLPTKMTTLQCSNTKNLHFNPCTSTTQTVTHRNLVPSSVVPQIVFAGPTSNVSKVSTYSTCLKPQPVTVTCSVSNANKLSPQVMYSTGLVQSVKSATVSSEPRPGQMRIGCSPTTVTAKTSPFMDHIYLPSDIRISDTFSLSTKPTTVFNNLVSTPVSAGSLVSTPVSAGSLVSTPVSAVSRVSTPVSAGSLVSTPVSAVSLVSTPVSAVSLISTPMSAVSLVSTPVSAVSLVSTPVSAGSLVSTPVSAVSLVSTPVSAGSLVSTPVSAVSLVSTPVSAGSLVSTPVSAGSLVSTPVSAVSLVSTPVSAGSLVSTPVSAGSLVSTPVSAGSLVSTPVSAVSLVSTPVSAGSLVSTPVSPVRLVSTPVSPVISSSSSATCIHQSVSSVHNSVVTPQSMLANICMADYTKMTFGSRQYLVPKHLLLANNGSMHYYDRKHDAHKPIGVYPFWEKKKPDSSTVCSPRSEQLLKSWTNRYAMKDKNACSTEKSVPVTAARSTNFPVVDNGGSQTSVCAPSKQSLLHAVTSQPEVAFPAGKKRHILPYPTCSVASTSFKGTSVSAADTSRSKIPIIAQSKSSLLHTDASEASSVPLDEKQQKLTYSTSSVESTHSKSTSVSTVKSSGSKIGTMATSKQSGPHADASKTDTQPTIEKPKTSAVGSADTSSKVVIRKDLKELMTKCEPCRVVINRLPIKRTNKRCWFHMKVAQKMCTFTSCTLKCKKAYIKRLFRHGDPLAPALLWNIMQTGKTEDLPKSSNASIRSSGNTVNSVTTGSLPVGSNKRVNVTVTSSKTKVSSSVTATTNLTSLICSNKGVNAPVIRIGNSSMTATSSSVGLPGLNKVLKVPITSSGQNVPSSVTHTTSSMFRLPVMPKTINVGNISSSVTPTSLSPFRFRSLHTNTGAAASQGTVEVPKEICSNMASSVSNDTFVNRNQIQSVAVAAKSTTPYVAVASKSTTPYVAVASKSTTPYVAVASKSTTPYVAVASKSTTPYVAVASKSTTPYVALPSKSTTPYVALPSKSTTPYVALPSKSTTPYVALPSKSTTPYVALPSKSTTHGVAVAAKLTTLYVAVTSKSTTPYVAVASKSTTPGVAVAAKLTTPGYRVVGSTIGSGAVASKSTTPYVAVASKSTTPGYCVVGSTIGSGAGTRGLTNSLIKANTTANLHSIPVNNQPHSNVPTSCTVKTNVSTSLGKDSAVCLVNVGNKTYYLPVSVANLNSYLGNSLTSLISTTNTAGLSMAPVSTVQTIKTSKTTTNSLGTSQSVTVKTEPKTYLYGDEGTGLRSLVTVKEEPMNRGYSDEVETQLNKERSKTGGNSMKRKLNDASKSNFESKKQKKDISQQSEEKGEHEQAMNESRNPLFPKETTPVAEKIRRLKAKQKADLEKLEVLRKTLK